MTTWATPYEAAGPPCSGRAQAGTIALSIVVKGLFPRTTNLGIYNCRDVGDGETWSIHSDGRAWDCGIPTLPGGRPDLGLGDPILHLLAAHAVELGIQCVIWNDTLYSARHPDGTPYGGVSPHYDHIHIEQQWEAALHLSVNEVAAILAGGQHGGEGGGTPIPPPGDDELSAAEVEKILTAVRGAVTGTMIPLGQVAPGQARTIPISEPRGDFVKTGAMFLRIAWGNNEPGTETVRVHGKQMFGVDDGLTKGLFQADTDAWNRDVPPRGGRLEGQGSIELLTGCDAIFVANQSDPALGRVIELVLEMLPRF